MQFTGTDHYDTLTPSLLGTSEDSLHQENDSSQEEDTDEEEHFLTENERTPSKQQKRKTSKIKLTPHKDAAYKSPKRKLLRRKKVAAKKPMEVNFKEKCKIQRPALYATETNVYIYNALNVFKLRKLPS